MEWWEDYFDEIYLRLYKFLDNPERVKREANFIEKALELKRDMKILDLACGQGRHVIELAKRGYKITGFDYSDYLLKVAKERAEKENVEVEFIKGDMRNLPFENEFDAIYNMFTSFGYFSDSDNFKVIEGVSNSLKPGGRFLLDVFNLFYLIKNFQQEFWMLTENFICLEQNEFDPVRMRSRNLRILFEKGKEIDRREHEVRMYTPAELSFLFELAEMKTEKFYGGYDLSEYSENSRRLIVVGRKARDLR